MRLWRKLPDAPTGDDLDAWREFRDAHGLGRVRSGELAELKKDVERERLRKLRRENALRHGSRKAHRDIQSQWFFWRDLPWIAPSKGRDWARLC